MRKYENNLGTSVFYRFLSEMMYWLQANAKSSANTPSLIALKMEFPVWLKKCFRSFLLCSRLDMPWCKLKD